MPVGTSVDREPSLAVPTEAPFPASLLLLLIACDEEAAVLLPSLERLLLPGRQIGKGKTADWRSAGEARSSRVSLRCVAWSRVALAARTYRASVRTE
jgi:hypothetical protein